MEKGGQNNMHKNNIIGSFQSTSIHRGNIQLLHKYFTGPDILLAR